LVYWVGGYEAYRKGDYRASLEIFEKWGVPGLCWRYHTLAMNYGQLNMKLEAQPAFRGLLEL